MVVLVVSVGRLLQSMIVSGGGGGGGKRCSYNQFCNIGQGIEVEGHVLGFVCVCVCVCVCTCMCVCVCG